MLNLDTHVLLYALTDDLTPRERALLSNETWSISAIVLWEIAKLAELGRIDIDLDHAELARTLARIQTWPLTLDICRSISLWILTAIPPMRSLPPPASCIECLS
jgi:PIN domain nuclease of toxin-antitoxin system